MTEQVSSLTHHDITVLLVDDQAMIGEAVRRMLAGEKDIRFQYCNDPTQAVETAVRISPTVILQDLVMPEIDGLTLVQNYRANPATKDVPLIVLSTKEEPVVKAEAFSLGANDYLVKLPDKVELIARIRYHSKGYINLLERNEAYDALLRSQQRLAKELSEAADYVRTLLPQPLDVPISTSWKFVPSTQLGGDSFGYHWLDENSFALYLLDVCGHGVGAALLSVSVMNVLRSQTLPFTDFHDPSQVLSRLNETFPMSQNNNMYFTMWYGVFQKDNRRLTYASGGHPPAALISFDQSSSPSILQLATPNLVIGAIPQANFKSAICDVGAGTSLYVYSDGVYEVTRPDGSMLERDEFIALLGQLDKESEPLESVHGYLCDLQKCENFEDDFSIMRVKFQ